MWRLTFPFSLPSFSLPFLYSSFLFTLESSFSSDLSDLCGKWKRIKNYWLALQGIKGWSLSGLSSGSSLKFALSKVINFLISHNNTNSQSGSNIISEERKSSHKRIFIAWTTCSQRYFHNTCVTDSKDSWFKYLRSKRTYPFKGAHGIVFAKTILQHLLSPSTKFLEYD